MRLGGMVGGLLVMVVVSVACQSRMRSPSGTSSGALAPGAGATSMPTRELPWSAGFEVGIVPTVNGVKAEAAPQTDGALGEGCWQQGPWASGFVDVAGRQRARVDTRAAVAYDEGSLYVALVCSEPEPGGMVIKGGRAGHDDEVWQDDCVEVLLSPGEGAAYYQFIVNPAGVRGEYRNRKADWDGQWSAKAVVGAGEWRAEMAIPFQTLGVTAPRAGEVWRVNFVRERKGKKSPEDSAWAPAFGNLHQVARLGRLVFADAASGAGLRPAGRGDETVLQKVRLTKAPETGSNPVEITLVSASGRRLRVVVANEVGGGQEAGKGQAAGESVVIKGQRTVSVPLVLDRPGAFLASVKVFEEDQLVAQQHLSGVAARLPGTPMAHPRLYFGAEDLPGLRRKTEHPMFKGDWEAIRQSAEAALEGPALGEGRPSQVLPGAAGAAATCAFVYRVSGEARFGKRAREICEAVLASEGWTGDFLGMGNASPRFHLGTAAICQGMALAYDLLAEEMTAEQRQRFTRTCYERALKAYIEECQGPANPYLNGSRTMNWLAVLSSGAGCLFIALDGDGMDFAREIEIARAHTLRFVEWYDDDGSAVEHGVYWVYGMGNALHLFKALKENGWPEILQQTSRKLERTAYPILYGCIGGKNVANFCDDSYGPLSGGRDNVLLLAAEYQDPRLQWWAGQLPAAGVLGFVCGDGALAATAPDDLPTCMAFGRTGIGVMRQSLSDPETIYLALKAGRGRATNFDDPHCQFDLNSVVLDAFGAPLLADPGYGHDWTGNMTVTDPRHPTNSTPPHNTVLVDGQGQEVQWSPLAWLEDLSPAKDVDYLVSRMEQGYGPTVARFDRHVYFVDKRFYVLVDDVELTTPGVISWNFHAAKGAKLSVGEAAGISNGPAELGMKAVSAVKLTCSQRDDHVLPRLQWDTAAKVKGARVAWVLVPRHSGGEAAALPTVELQADGLRVSEGAKQWRLPIVRRRVGYKSSMTLIREPKP